MGRVERRGKGGAAVRSIRCGCGPRETRQRGAPYFSAVCTDTNLPLTAEPRLFTDTMMTSATPEAMIAYSIEVAPALSARNFARSFFMAAPFIQMRNQIASNLATKDLTGSLRFYANWPGLRSTLIPARRGGVVTRRGKSKREGMDKPLRTRVCWRRVCNRRILSMIDLHYWTTPNGHKITIFLEEAGLPYKIFPVNIGKRSEE